MQDTTKVGKYVDNNIGYLRDPGLNKILNEIIEKISNNPNLDEQKAISKKLRLTRLPVFEGSAFIINHILSFKDYKKKLIELSEKLDTYVNVDKIDYSTIIDFSNDLSSKMKFHSTLIVRNMKDDLKEEELRKLIEEINKNNSKVINRVLKDYTNWYEKVKDDKELYDYFKNFESKALVLARLLLETTVKKIEEDKEVEAKVRNMDLARRIDIYNFKHRTLRRSSSEKFN